MTQVVHGWLDQSAQRLLVLVLVHVRCITHPNPSVRVLPCVWCRSARWLTALGMSAVHPPQPLYSSEYIAAQLAIPFSAACKRSQTTCLQQHHRANLCLPPLAGRR